MSDTPITDSVLTQLNTDYVEAMDIFRRLERENQELKEKIEKLEFHIKWLEGSK